MLLTISYFGRVRLPPPPPGTNDAKEFSASLRNRSLILSLTPIWLSSTGTRLFFLDRQKKTIESCGPRGENHKTLMTITNNHAVLEDVEWYRGTPLWTESVFPRGVIVLNSLRHVSPASTNVLRFNSPAGIHIYHGNLHLHNILKNWEKLFAQWYFQGIIHFMI